MTENIAYPHTQAVTRMHSSRMRTAHFSARLAEESVQAGMCPAGGLCLP